MAYFRSNVSGGIPAGVRTLPTVDTASGSIATFNTDLTENLVDVKCQIVATQSGSDTPSPSNPRPITTYMEMNLSHCGKNLFDESYPSIGTLKYMSIFVGNGTFTMSTDLPTRTDTYANLFFLANQVSSGADSALNGVYNNRPVTVTSTDGYVTIAYRYDQYNPRDYHTQIEHGTTATTYEPYNATTANIPFGQTVANGVLDIISGKLRVTHGIVDLGTLNWTFLTPWGFQSNTAIPDAKYPPTNNDEANIKTSIYRLASANGVFASVYDYCIAMRSDGRIAIHDKDKLSFTASQFKTAMSGVIMIYELATPIEIQLDSITLQALLNENNIWCDTGDTEVKFLLTVGKKIS